MTRALFAVAALPALARAAARVVASRREPIDHRADRLRAVPRFRARWLADPVAWSAVAGRIGERLPLGGGPCLRRALLLLDLHSRCGLAPRLALAFRPGEGTGEGHAWVTTDPVGERGGTRGGERVWQPVVVL